MRSTRSYSLVTTALFTTTGTFGSLPGNGPPSGASSTFAIASATSIPAVTWPKAA
ncbi:hypothetical protein D3C83_310680 [compost metagenome]